MAKVTIKQLKEKVENFIYYSLCFIFVALVLLMGFCSFNVIPMVIYMPLWLDNYNTFMITGQLSTWPFVVSLAASIGWEICFVIFELALKHEEFLIDVLDHIIRVYIPLLLPTHIAIIASIVLIIYSLFV